MNNPYAPLLQSQKQFFLTHRTLDPEYRRQQLRLLKGAILRHQRDLEEALFLDLGKGSTESWFTEIGLTLSAIDWQIRHLGFLSRPRCHLPPVHQFPSLARTIVTF